MSTKENQSQINRTITKPETEIKVQTQLQPDDWLCLACSKKITEDRERFSYDGQSEFQFTNPDGYVFDIITFHTADGCREEGKPSLYYTWFKDHSWSYAICSRCGLHLGWKYSGNAGEPDFYGLIKARLIKGIALFN